MSMSIVAAAPYARPASAAAAKGTSSWHSRSQTSKAAAAHGAGQKAASVRALARTVAQQPVTVCKAVSDAGVEGGVSSSGSSSMKGRQNRAGVCGEGASAAQRDEFFELARKGHNLIPLHRRIFADQLTPILAYR